MMADPSDRGRVRSWRPSIAPLLGITITLVVAVVTVVQMTHFTELQREAARETISLQAGQSVASMQRNLAAFMSAYAAYEYEQLIAAEVALHEDVLAIVVEDDVLAEVIRVAHPSGSIRTGDGAVVAYEATDPTQRALLAHARLTLSGEITDPEGARLGAVTVYMSDSRLRRYEQEIATQTLQASLAAALVLIGLLIWLVNRLFVRPLARITDAIRRTEGDGIPQPVSTDQGYREIAVLGETINEMLAAIRSSREQLEQEFARHQAMLRNASDGVCVLDDRQAVVECSDSFCEMLGYGRDAVIGMHVRQWDCGLSDSELEKLHASLRLGERMQFETRHRTRHGHEYPVEVSAFMVNYGGEDLVFCSTRDITERREAERLLADKQAFYRQIFEVNTAIKLIIDPASGDIVDANHAAACFYGYPVERLVTMTLFDICITSPEALQEEMALARDEQRLYFNVRHRLASGEIRDVELYSGPVHFGERALLYSIIHDITERTRQQRELIEQRRRLNDILLGTNAGTWEWSVPDGSTVFNERWAEMIGFTLAELQPTTIDTWASRCHPDDLARSNALMAQHFDGTRPYYECEARMRHRDGHWVWILDRGKVVRRDDSGQPLLMSGTHQDISAQKHAEATLMEAKAAAEAASRAKSDFLANMSHEIRTPMNAVLGLLKLLGHTPLDPRQADYVGKAEGAANSLLGLINDILDYSRVESGRLELEDLPFPLEALVNALAVVLNEALRSKPIELLFDLDPALPSVLRGDRLRLQQVLLNLASNAIKFTDQGEIVVRLSQHRDDDGQLWFDLAVADTGIGIAPERQQAIFESFTQAESSTSRRYGGSGLGLSISRHLVEAMGGQLSVTSALGEGARFAFSIPLRGESGPLTPVPGAGRVLVVDRHASTRAVLVRILDALGASCQVAGSARAALACLDAPDGAADLVLLDAGVADGTDERAAFSQLLARPLVRVCVMRTVGAMLPAEDLPASVAVIIKPLLPSVLRALLEDGQAPGPLPEAIDPDGAALSLAGLHLLLVDDNVLNQEVGSELLRFAGADVTVVGGGREAVALLTELSHDFDAVLMDIQMPDMDGYAATRALRAAGVRLPVIAVTANAMASDREACLAAGMDDHVGKPIDMPTVVSVLRQHCPQRPGSREVRRPSSAPVPTVAHADTASVTAAGASGEATPAPLPAALDDCSDGLELMTALQRLGNNRTVLARVIRQFVTQQHVLMQQASDALPTRDMAAARRALHTLKGLAATVGASELAAEVAAVESWLKARGGDGNDGDDEMRQTAAGLSHRLSTLQARIDATEPRLLSAARDLDAVAPAPSGAADDARLLTTLDEMIRLLGAQNMRVLEFGDMLRTAAAIPHRDAAEAILQAVEQLDFPLALERASELRNRISG